MSQPHTTWAAASPRVRRWGARRDSARMSHAASPVNVAPRIISMWVGLHMVTSTPYARCHTSSSGNPDTAPSPRAHSGTQRPGHAQRADREALDPVEGGDHRAEHGAAEDHR